MGLRRRAAAAALAAGIALSGGLTACAGLGEETDDELEQVDEGILDEGVEDVEE